MTAISTTRAVERCERLAELGSPPAWWRVFALRRWLRAYRAIMALDIGASAEMLRQLYPAGHVHEMAARANPTAAMLSPTPRPVFGADQRPGCIGSYGSNHSVPLSCSPAAGCGLRGCPWQRQRRYVDPIELADLMEVLNDQQLNQRRPR